MRLFQDCACEVEYHTEYAIFRPCLSHVIRGVEQVHIPIPPRPDLSDQTIQAFIDASGFPEM